MRSGAVLLGLAGLSAVIVTGALGIGPREPKPGTSAAVTPLPSNGTLVYYFHASVRCSTCRTIEAYARETVETAFAADLKARSLTWLAVNVQEPANEHFVRDYQLYTRSVVVVDGKDPKRFKVLERVWELVHDKAAFQRYVEQEIRAFRRS